MIVKCEDEQNLELSQYMSRPAQSPCFCFSCSWCPCLWHLHFRWHLCSHTCSYLTTLVAMQIASTWEGIRACEALQKQGIDCNMTLLFSFAQARSCGQSSHDYAYALAALGAPAWIHAWSLVLAAHMLRALCDTH